MTTFLTANSTLPPYMAFPSFLLDCDFSETTKLLYMVLLNRARLSQKMTAGLIKRSCVLLFHHWRYGSNTSQKPDNHQNISECFGTSRPYLSCSSGNRESQPDLCKSPGWFSTQTEEKLSVRQSENRPFDRQNSVRQTVRKLSPNNKEKKNNDSVKRHYECKEDESLW